MFLIFYSNRAGLDDQTRMQVANEQDGRQRPIDASWCSNFSFIDKRCSGSAHHPTDPEAAGLLAAPRRRRLRPPFP
jgi:hypothetical protein